MRISDLSSDVCSSDLIAAVTGFAIGGGHVFHVICDVTISAGHAQFGQVGPRVGSFDAGWGIAYLAQVVGQKRAREIWMFCQRYSAEKAERMGLVNKVVPKEKLMEEARDWALAAAGHSPTALRSLTAAANAASAQAHAVGALPEHGLDHFVQHEQGWEGR